MIALTRAACQALDAADPLAAWRERFALPHGVIYLDGNSLGPLPKATADVLDDVVRRQWGHDLITSWNKHGWVDLPQRLGAKIARLIGAHPHEVIVAEFDLGQSVQAGRGGARAASRAAGRALGAGQLSDRSVRGAGSG